MVKGTMGWLNDNKTIYFQSEKSGYSHLNFYHLTSNKTEQLTHGDFEIHQVILSRDNQSFYITANKNHPGNRSFYQFIIKTKEWIPILTDNGNFQVSIGPKEKQLTVRYSYKNKPWEMYTSSLQKESPINQITHSTNDSFDNHKWIDPEIVKIKKKINLKFMHGSIIQQKK